MASAEAEDIVKRMMPGVEIVQRRREDAVDASREEATDRPTGGPSLDDIKKKYENYSDAAEDAGHRTMSYGVPDVDEDDIEVVQVMSPGALTDDVSPQVRAVIVSKKLGNIIGKQG